MLWRGGGRDALMDVRRTFKLGLVGHQQKLTGHFETENNKMTRPPSSYPQSSDACRYLS